MKKRVLFLGQKPIGEACFNALAQNRGDALEIAGVVSNDDLDNWWKTAGIFDQAKQLEIPFISNQKRNNEEILALIEREKIDTILSVQHKWILPKAILDAVNGFCFNLHMAKLPEYKGYNTFSFAILNGDKEYYTTIHWLAEQVDEGDIAIERSVEILPDETAHSLYQKVSKLSLRCFEELVHMLKTGEKIPRRPVRGEHRFYGKGDLEAIKEIKDLSDPAYTDRVLRACSFPNFEPPYVTVAGCRYFLVKEERQP